MGQIGSLDKHLTDEESGTVGDLVPSSADVEEDVLDVVEQEQLKDILWPLVDTLEGNQPAVIRARYQEGKTLKATGDGLGVTVAAVRQIEAKALRELRKPSMSRHLRPFTTEGEWIYSMGIVGNGAERFRTTWTSSTERAALQIM